MSKLNSPLPHDLEAEDLEFRKAFADAMRKASPVFPLPVQKPSPSLGGSGEVLAGDTPTLQTFQKRVIPGPVVKIQIDRYVRVNLIRLNLTKPSGFWFRYFDVNSRHGEFLGRRGE